LDGFQRALQDFAREISAGRIISWIVLELLAKGGRESLVCGIVEFGRIPTGGQDAQRLVAHVPKDGFVERRHAADRGNHLLEAIFDELSLEAKSIRSGGAEEYCVRRLHLGDVAAIVG